MLISQKQNDANRRNSLLSTGPATEQGKAAVRFNALRHGLRARSLLLPGENSDDLRQLFQDLESEWRPQTRTEHLLVEQMAVAQWKLARLEVGERSIFMQEMPAEKQLALLDRFSTQRSRLERSFSNAVRELSHLRNAVRRTQASDKTAGRRPLNTGDAGDEDSFPPQSPYVMAPPGAALAT